MNDMTFETNIALPAAESAPLDVEVEDKLKNAIQSLWLAHQKTKAMAMHSNEEFKALRLDLGRKLNQVKSILARTGRGGGWAAYLRSCELPRASAERLIQRYELVVNPKQIDSPETFHEPSDEEVRRLVRNLLPRLRRVLVTPSWMEWFLVEVQYQWETADASSTSGRVDGAGSRAQDSGDPKTQVVLLSDAA
jgi:hypothetical protein